MAIFSKGFSVPATLALDEPNVRGVAVDQGNFEVTKRIARENLAVHEKTSSSTNKTKLPRGENGTGGSKKPSSSLEGHKREFKFWRRSPDYKVEVIGGLTGAVLGVQYTGSLVGLIAGTIIGTIVVNRLKPEPKKKKRIP